MSAEEPGNEMEMRIGYEGFQAASVRSDPEQSALSYLSTTDFCLLWKFE